MRQYLAFRLLAFLAPVVPPRFAYWLCDLIADVAYRLLPRQRATVLRNLSVIMKDCPVSTKEKMARATFREGVRYYYETFRVPALSDDELTRLVHLDGLEHLDAALRRGKGAIMFTGHFGNPALAVQLIAQRGIKITTVVEPIRPQRLFDLVNGARANRGIRYLPLGPSIFKVLAAALARNEVAGIVGDRDLQGTGVSVKLFGAATRFPAGAVMLALRTGAPVLPAFGWRDPDGLFRGFVGEPIEMDRTRDLREDIRVNTQKLADVLESLVARNPEKWIIFEPIWQEGAAEPAVGA